MRLDEVLLVCSGLTLWYAWGPMDYSFCPSLAPRLSTLRRGEAGNEANSVLLWWLLAQTQHLVTWCVIKTLTSITCCQI